MFGAGLGTYNLFIQIREKKSQIQVSLDPGLMASSLGFTSDPMMYLQAVNVGSRPTTLVAFGVRLPDGKTGNFLAPMCEEAFPHELLPGRKCTVRQDCAELAAGLRANGYKGKVKLVGIFRDATGKVYTGKAYRFDIEGWLNYGT